MTERNPLVIKDGRVQELPKGDTARGSEGPAAFRRDQPLPFGIPDELRFQLLVSDLFIGD